MDSKSIGLCPQGFESPRCRFTKCSALNATARRCGARAQVGWGKRATIARDRAVPKGAWCSGITSASHAEGPGFKSQCVHLSIATATALVALALAKGRFLGSGRLAGDLEGTIRYMHAGASARAGDGGGSLMKLLNFPPRRCCSRRTDDIKR